MKRRQPQCGWYPRALKAARTFVHCTAAFIPSVLFLFIASSFLMVYYMTSVPTTPRPHQLSVYDSSEAFTTVNVAQELHDIDTGDSRKKRFRDKFEHITLNQSLCHNLTVDEIRNNILWYNSAQTVYNEDGFGPVTNDTIVIVIQVHSRLEYLQHLISSLSQAWDIASTLIIFSHDYYDEEINALVQSIGFAKVMQIFYPHSIQTHPHEFPGESPGDCPRDISREKALITGCINAKTPDQFGHYREAYITQIKHHWWWKANRVFNQLLITKKHNGLVLFLEEDHFVAQDFLHCLRKMEEMIVSSCPTCDILSLGTYLSPFNYPRDSEKADIMPWVSGQHNMGFTLNRSVWLKLQCCAKYFCTYDDYNWDWSLQHVSANCLARKLQAMVLRAPRVFHIGECGVHIHKTIKCENTGLVNKIKRMLSLAVIHLFPSQLELGFVRESSNPFLLRGFGGWGDPRDHDLCISMTDSSSKILCLKYLKKKRQSLRGQHPLLR